MPSATATATATAPTSTAPPPVTATDWAYAILLGLGIDPTGKNNSITALIAQMHVEDPSLTYLTSKNNPLAVTNPGGTAIPGNSAGVQEYGNWTTGLASTVADIKANPAMLAALRSNASCQQYGAALGKSTWEGSGGNNASYGASVAGSCGDSNVQSNTASSAFGSWLANNESIGPNILSQTGDAALSAAGTAVSWTASLGTLLAKLDSVTFWERIGLFVLGLMVFMIGLAVFVSTTKTGQKAESTAVSLAPLAMA